MGLVKKICVFVLGLCIVSVAQAQSVGLVLSGGGAKGLAHIGVIRALEDNEIPIDYVTGTSIGAIIGSLYAMGFSPDEMEEMFRSSEFYEWYNGEINDKYTFYYKRYDEKPDMVNLSLDQVDSTLSFILPTNLVATQPMDLAFLKIFTSYSALADYDFDNLFVPFRCVATDVYNNHAVLLKDGDLGMSVRASMTFPFYFRPISIDGNLLFDGGIVNNFPEDVMREEFDPDIIIGSKVASVTQKPREDQVLEQIENMIMAVNTRYEIAPEDGILIANDFANISLLDFHKFDYLHEVGYNSTMELMDSIKKRVSRRVSEDSIHAAREAFQYDLPEFLVDNIYIEGANVQQKDYIRKSLKQNKKLLDFEQFEIAYYRLIADNHIESALPVAKFNKETGFFDLYLNVKQEKPYHVMVGANVSSSSVNQGFVGVEYKLLKRRANYLHANIHFGRLYTSFQGLYRIDFVGKLPFYLQTSLTYNRWDFFKSNPRLLFLDATPSYLIQNENNLRFDFGLPVGSKSKLEFGGAYARMLDEYYQTNNFLQTDTADITTFDLVTAHLRFERKTLNHKLYPTEGVFDRIDLRYIRGKENHYPGTTSAQQQDYGNQHGYFLLNMYHDRYYEINSHYSIGTTLEIVASNKTFYRNYISSLLSASAFTPTPHAQTLFLKNFRANTYSAFGLKQIARFTDNLCLRLEGYAFIPFWNINFEESEPQVFTPYYESNQANIHFITNANLVYHSPVGPVSFSINYYDEERNKWFFLFHFGYILFNERGIE
ncbi:MAG: patatin-like phospholipase family protein [Bacteroidota bacterium]|nr:patatin-like phospholipase family protein [Bacteroidota bacterium]